MKVVVSLCQGCSSLGLSWNVVWPSPHAAHQPPGQVRPLMLMIRNYSRNILKYFGLGVPGPLTSIWQCGCKVAHHNVKTTSQKLLIFLYFQTQVLLIASEKVNLETYFMDLQLAVGHQCSERVKSRRNEEVLRRNIQSTLPTWLLSKKWCSRGPAVLHSKYSGKKWMGEVHGGT